MKPIRLVLFALTLAILLLVWRFFGPAHAVGSGLLLGAAYILGQRITKPAAMKSRSVPLDAVPNFVADPSAHRTYDPDSGFELFSVGGGSGGDLIFKIVGPTSETQFLAHIVHSMTDKEKAYSGLSLSPSIWQVDSWDKDWEPIIFGALRAYKSVNGRTIKNRQYYVRFGPKGVLMSA